ncbi:oligosaccharide flippase family protein, partial [Vibrio parahaemolyticus]|uniref:oligosaccharide flippase family protein n=1 Tax=Vibrio parahaemolyticus TaxID=670 RepID=UPI0011245C69
NSPDDYFLVPLIDGVGAIFVGIVSIYIARNKNDFLKYVPTMFDIKEQVVNGKDIFFSQIVVYFYTSFNVFLLGLLLSPNLVGYYTLAEKIYSAIRGVLKPLNQAVFPYLSRVYGNDFSIFCHSAKVLTLVYLLFLSFACSVCYFFSNEIIELVSGNRIEKAGFILEVFALALLFGIGSLYTSLLVIKSQSKYLFKITLLTTTFNLVFVYPVTINFGIVGMAYLYLSTQVFQFLLQIYHNRDIWIYKV